jgi:putative peptidoglycan lipid II flippase
MALGTLAARLTGFARLFALAYALGFDHLADAYNLANTTPNIVYDLVLGGVLSATVVPVFVDRLTTRSRREAWDDVSAVLTLSVVVLVVATAVFALLAPQIIALYTLGNHEATVGTQRAVATFLLRLFAAQVACYGAISLATAVLNACRRFAAPMVTPVVNNLVVIAVLLVAAPTVRRLTLAGHGQVLGPASHDTGLLVWLGLGTTAGVALQFLALAPSLRAARPPLRIRFDPRNPAVRSIVRLSGYTLGFVVANQVALFVVLALADTLRQGSVSAYTYAYTFFQVPYGIAAVSVMSAVQPELAERFATGDLAAFRRRLGTGLRATLVVVVPAAVGYLVLARPLVELVLGHGAARATSPGLTAGALSTLAVGLPGFSAYLYLTRAYQAMQDTRTVFYLYLVENGLNVVLAFALYRRFGVAGLGSSLSIAYTAAAVLAAAGLRRRLGGLEGRLLARSLWRTTWASAVMALAVVLVLAGVGGGHGLGLLARVVAAVATGVTVFLLAIAFGTARHEPVLRRGRHARQRPLKRFLGRPHRRDRH